MKQRFRCRNFLARAIPKLFCEKFFAEKSLSRFAKTLEERSRK